MTSLDLSGQREYRHAMMRSIVLLLTILVLNAAPFVSSAHALGMTSAGVRAMSHMSVSCDHESQHAADTDQCHSTIACNSHAAANCARACAGMVGFSLPAQGVMAIMIERSSPVPSTALVPEDPIPQGIDRPPKLRLL
ncbi:hypothetical protein [Salinicola peritrichatus]|uniref:hypothetical protein n=1 Tax=Salinicola peritrichatus TaxID=1267424 RepID=UPI0013A66E76|nr:hypothetical protein [Salinicola peritrichatus]